MIRRSLCVLSALSLTTGLCAEGPPAQSGSATQSPAIRMSPGVSAPVVIPGTGQVQVLPPAAAMPSLDSVLAWDSWIKEITVTYSTRETQCDFNLTNISPSDVTITSVFTSCGCAVPKLPPLPWTLAPGSNGQIHVTMDLTGESGTLIKSLSITTSNGFKTVYVKTTILPPTADELKAIERDRNRKVALTDRQAVFKGTCAKCHADPARDKSGQALYQAVCGICHEAERRDAMVPNLHTLARETSADYWMNWISRGKPGSLMPAFAKSEDGILDDAQVASLVEYLTAAIPSKPSAQSPKAPGSSR